MISDPREHAIREMALITGLGEAAKCRTEAAKVFLAFKWLKLLKRKGLLLPPL